MNPKEAINNFKNKKILVIGDVMLDRYTEGSVERISAEAPVPVVKKTNDRYVLGGAANVAGNLSSLGAKTALAGIIGNDARKITALKLLKESGIATNAIFTDDRKPTAVKQRIVSAGHQILRIDDESETELSEKEEKDFFGKMILPEIKNCDAVILSDYAKGLFSESLSRKVIDSAKENRKPIIADFRPKNKKKFIGADVITPNTKEAEEMTGFSQTGGMEKIGALLVKHFSSHVLVTRGENGVDVFTKDGGSKHIPAKKVRVFDVTGAGDTFAAVAALGIASGLNIENAAHLANVAGGIVVQKPGTATVTLEELLQHAADTGMGQHVDAAKFVPKLWGNEKWLENNDKYCCKILTLKKGFQCSLHYHKIKDETFLIQSGLVRLEIGDEIKIMSPGNYIRILPDTPHRFRGLEDSEIIEISTHHEDSDSHRIEESRRLEGI